MSQKSKKEYIKKRQKEYNLKNKERIRERAKEYQLKNKERIRERAKEYQLKNKERIREQRKEYYNKPENKKHLKEYQLKNKERRAKKRKEWYLKNQEHMKEYRLKMKEYMKEYGKKYYQENIEATKVRHKKWRLENKEYNKKYEKEYRSRPEKRELIRNRKRNQYQTDINFRLKELCRKRVLSALKFNHKSARTMELIGCTIGELRRHLESLFEPWMTWENQGRGGWDVDHIIACATFDLTDPEQQRACFNWSNLQPLEHIENIKKGVG